MKKIFIMACLCVVTCATTAKAQSIAQLTTQLLLDMEKLSTLKDILSDMYKSYEILDKGYSTIKDIAQGNFNLHEVFLDGLLAVSPTVRNYGRIIDIINAEISIVSEYKTAFKSFQQDGHFTLDELDYISNVYSSLLNESLKNIDELTTVVTANQLRMSDDERISVIDRLYADMSKKLGFLRIFNKNISGQSFQRAKAAGDIDAMKSFYDIH